MNTVCTGDGNVKALKVLDLNAGLGGRIFAFEKAGFDIVGAVDFDKENCEIMESWLEKSKIIQADLLYIDPDDMPEADLIMGKYVQQSFSKHGEKLADKNVNMSIYTIIARKKPRVFLLEVPVSTITSKKYMLDEYLRLFSELGYRISYKVYDEMNFSGFPMYGKQGYIIGERFLFEHNFEFPNPEYYEATKKISFEDSLSIDRWYRIVKIPTDGWEKDEWYNSFRGKIAKTKSIHMGVMRVNYLVDAIGPRKFTHNEYALLKGLNHWEYNNCKNKRRMYDKIAYASNVYVLKAIADNLILYINKANSQSEYKEEVLEVKGKKKKKQATSKVLFPKYTLKEMHVKNLKGLKDLTIKFEKNLTAVMGVNGSGKSTILHALACIHSPYEKGEDYKFRDFFTPNPDATWKDSCFTVVSYDENEDKNLIRKFEKRKDRWAKYSNRPQRDVYYIGVSSCIPEIELEKRTSFINYVSKQEDNKLTNKIIGNASYILGKDYEKLLSHKAKNKSYIGVCTKKGTVYSALSMGAGEQRVIKLLQMVYNAHQYSMILIDEIDMLLHADAFRKLIEILSGIANDRHLQIIFTTHSLEMQELKEYADIRYIDHKGNGILVYDSINPDLLYELSGQRERPYSIYVEDDFAFAIVQQIARDLCMQRYINIITYGSINNAFTVAVGKVLDDADLKNVLIVTDGDEKVTDQEKRKAVEKILTGTENDHDDKVEKALSIITQFSLPANKKPEEFVHSLLIEMNDSDECVACAKTIKSVKDAHEWIGDIVNAIGPKEVVYSRIMSIVAEHEKWSYYVHFVREWLKTKKKEIEGAPVCK